MKFLVFYDNAMSCPKALREQTCLKFKFRFFNFALASRPYKIGLIRAIVFFGHKGGSMKKTFLWMVTVGMISVVHPARAMLLLEPYLLLVSGSSKGEGSNSNLGDWPFAKQERKGLLYGAKAGVDMPFLWRAGGVLEFSYLKSESDGVDRYIEKYSGSAGGFFVGPKFGPFYVDLNYFFSANLSGEDWAGSTAADASALFGKVERKSGSGFGFDLGYTFMPMVNFNVVYRRMSFDKLHVGGNIDTDVETEAKANYFGVGVSFPIDLF